MIEIHFNNIYEVKGASYIIDNVASRAGLSFSIHEQSDRLSIYKVPQSVIDAAMGLDDWSLIDQIGRFIILREDFIPEIEDRFDRSNDKATEALNIKNEIIQLVQG